MITFGLVRQKARTPPSKNKWQPEPLQFIEETCSLMSLLIARIYLADQDCLIRQYFHWQSHRMFDDKGLFVCARTCSSDTTDLCM